MNFVGFTCAMHYVFFFCRFCVRSHLHDPVVLPPRPDRAASDPPVPSSSGSDRGGGGGGSGVRRRHDGGEVLELTRLQCLALLGRRSRQSINLGINHSLIQSFSHLIIQSFNSSNSRLTFL